MSKDKSKSKKKRKHHHKKAKPVIQALSRNASEKELAQMQKELDATEDRAKRKKGRRRLRTRASKSNRTDLMKQHLKCDDAKDETVLYTVDHPNRVAVRMEYLMNTTKARLNDREFMNTLYQRLVGEEGAMEARITKNREWQEKNRVKKLVIEGKMDPPNDMKGLATHPVFRVNALMKRLKDFNRSMLVREQVRADITAVEPYEFDGDQFFRYLHQYGTYWIPPEEQLDEEERLAGKRARARLRHLENKYKQAEAQKLVKMVNTEKLSANLIDDGAIKRKPDELYHVFEERKRKYRIAQIKSQLFKESEKRAAAFRRKWEILEREETLRKEKAEQRRKERDIVFLGDRDQERKEYLNKFLNKVYSKTFVNHNPDGSLKPSGVLVSSYPPKKTSSDSSSSRSSSPSEDLRSKPISVQKIQLRHKTIDYQKLFEHPATPPTLHEDPSFIHLRETFKIGGGNRLSKFEPSKNPVFQKYITVAQTMDELAQNATDLTEMFNREQAYTDRCCAKLRRMDNQYKPTKL